MPNALLEQANLPEEVELHAEPGRIVVKAGRRVREGWAKAARLMRQRDEDHLLNEYSATRFDNEEWEWR